MAVTHYVWDPVTDAVIMETDENHDTTVVYDVEPEPYGRVIAQHVGGETQTFHYDALGSTREITDENENVIGTNMYDAWGVNRESTGVDTPYGWVGEIGYHAAQHDEVYVRRRALRPTLAQWTARDPLDDSKSRIDPYSYSQGQPVGRVDPSGLKAFRSTVIACGDYCDRVAAESRLAGCYAKCLQCAHVFDQWLATGLRRQWSQLPSCPCTLKRTSAITLPPISPQGAHSFPDDITIAGGTWIVPPGWSNDTGLNSTSIEIAEWMSWMNFPRGLHPGAAKCIRRSIENGARQQCCYDRAGKLIESGFGAGTADASGSLMGHWRQDVWPFICAWVLDGRPSAEPGRHLAEYYVRRPMNGGSGCGAKTPTPRWGTTSGVWPEERPRGGYWSSCDMLLDRPRLH